MARWTTIWQRRRAAVQPRSSHPSETETPSTSSMVRCAHHVIASEQRTTSFIPNRTQILYDQRPRQVIFLQYSTMTLQL